MFYVIEKFCDVCGTIDSRYSFVVWILTACGIDRRRSACSRSSHLHTRSSKSGVVWRNFIFCRALERILLVIYQRGKSRLHLKVRDPYILWSAIKGYLYLLSETLVIALALLLKEFQESFPGSYKHCCVSFQIWFASQWQNSRLCCVSLGVWWSRSQHCATAHTCC